MLHLDADAGVDAGEDADENAPAPAYFHLDFTRNFI